MRMPGTRHHGSALAIVWATALLAGCASLGPELPMATADESEPAEVAPGVRTLGPDGEFALRTSAEVARRLQASLGERPLSILALSSGGANGAFGAGALAGLATSGTRPEFTVVT